MSNPTTDSSLEIGSQFAGYRVVELLSQNPLGTMYLGEDEAKKSVFLRVVDESVCEPDTLETIERDLSLLADVLHRNVARVLGGSEEQEFFYYALEALGTTTLLDLAASCRPLYERELVWLGRGLTAGLAALHEKGMHHGGLVPGSVVVSHHGPIIVDLGWEDRLGSMETLGLDAMQLTDLSALREVLIFATSPVGSPAPFSPRVESLLASMIEPDEDGAPPNAAKVAEAWKQAAARLGLPDPMAPDSLKTLLERYEGAEAPAGSEPDMTAYAPSDEGDVESATGVVDSSDELTESDDLDDEDLDDEDLDDSDLRDLPTQAETIVSEELAASADTRRATVEYAQSLLADYPADPLSQDGLIPVAQEEPAPEGDDPSSDDDDDRYDSGSDTGGVDPHAETLIQPAPKSRKASNRSETGQAPTLGTFGSYELISELAAGRSSTIYLAKSASQERPLALKVMLPGSLSDPTAQSKFLREAKAASALQHKGIARVYESGVENGWAYVAFEFVKGRPLDEVCREESELAGQLPRIMLEVLLAVAYGHSRGIVHGDIKPKNILVTAEGTPHILEFGVPRLSKKGKQAPPISPYCAPELSSGASREVATDIYALGVTLFEVATQGTLPNKTGAFSRLMLGTPPAPSSQVPAIPWQLDSIVLTALAADPDERYSTADEMASDLQRCVLGPLQAPRGSRPYRLRLWVVKQPLTAALTLVGVVALLALLGFGGAALLERRPVADVAEKTPASKTRPASKTGKTTAPDPRTQRELAALQAKFKGLQSQHTQLDAAHRQLQTDQARLARERDDARQALQDARNKTTDADATLQRKLAIRADVWLRYGRQLLSAGQGQLAKDAFTQSLSLRPGHGPAESGRAEAQALIDNPPKPTGGADAGEAEKQLQLGRRHLQAKRYDAARTAFLAAFSGGAQEARSLLDRTQAALVEARLEAAASDRRERAAREAKQEVERGQSHLARGSYDQAWAAFQRALAKDPRNTAAIAGAQQAERKRATASSGGQSHDAQVAQERKTASDAFMQARTLYRRGEDSSLVTDAYLKALQALVRATLLDPDSKGLKAEKDKVAGELASILREDGQQNFAEMILKFSGLDPKQRVRVSVPKDPYLVVEEAQRESIRRAFGGAARFERTRAFDDLRTWVRRQGGTRYRITVRVISRVQPGFPPKIYATGLQLRLEDKQRRTLSPWKSVTFSGGPFKRVVRVDSRGRIVLPFTRSNPLNPRPYVAEASDIVKALVREAKGKK